MVTEPGWRRFRPMSIALRTAAWYALSAFALIVVATGFLYWVLITNLAYEDNRTLADNLDSMRLLLHSSPGGALPLRPEQPLGWWTSSRQPQSYFRILDDGGRVILETPGLSSELPPPAPAELTAVGSTEAASHDVVSLSGKLFQILSARVAGNSPDAPVRFVQVAMNRANDDDLLAHYRERMWLVLSVSVILCSLVGYAIARGGMRPIESMGRTAERVRSATLHERIETAGLPGELSGLAETFNAMLDRLEESFARISQFSDDAAHELRAPVNNLRGEIEVALSKDRSSADYREILGSCLEECTRISRVIQGLLFLARAEGASQALPRDRIKVGKELASVQEFYDAAAVDAGVTLGVLTAADLWAPLDRTLFQQAVSNLVANAIAHTPKGGAVEITAAAGPSWLEVSVADTGCGIAPEHLSRIFDRFYRVDRARSGSEHNVGLGLAVVKSIVSRHGGNVDFHSEPGAGTKVRMKFPRFP